MEATYTDIPLPDCARHLTRLRPSYGQQKQGHISLLIEQCKNFHQNQEILRENMQATMEKIEGERT